MPGIGCLLRALRLAGHWLSCKTEQNRRPGDRGSAAVIAVVVAAGKFMPGCGRNGRASETASVVDAEIAQIAEIAVQNIQTIQNGIGIRDRHLIGFGRLGVDFLLNFAQDVFGVRGNIDVNHALIFVRAGSGNEIGFFKPFAKWRNIAGTNFQGLPQFADAHFAVAAQCHQNRYLNKSQSVGRIKCMEQFLQHDIDIVDPMNNVIVEIGLREHCIIGFAHNIIACLSTVCA